jgi:hypothetical protein
MSRSNSHILGIRTLKNTSCLILVLSISILGVIATASAQKSATANRVEIVEADPHPLQDYQALSSCAGLGKSNVFTTSSASEVSALQKYNAMSALAMDQRKAAFRNASIVEKSELWRTHLALFLNKRPQLSELQKDVVLAAMALATPDWFEARSGADKRRVDVRLRSLEERIVAAFSKEDRVRIFATLGGEPAPCASTPDQRNTVLPNTINDNETTHLSPFNSWTNEPVWQDLQQDETCQCSTESDWCPMFSLCTTGKCTRTNGGCGIFWNYACDGKCRDGKPAPSPTPSPKPSPRPPQEVQGS